MQDATKMLLGSTGSSAKHANMFDADPATYKAGLAVRLKSDSTLSIVKADGMLYGVSLGRSLADSKKTSVLRDGLRVPILASYKRASCIVTISAFASLLTTTADTLAVAGVTFTAQAGAATLGTGTFQAATSNNATATSLAAQINGHATANLKVYAVASSATVTIYSIADGVGSTGTGNDIAVAYTDNGGGNIGITIAGLSGGKLAGGLDTVAGIDYMTRGAKAYVNDATGKLDANITGYTTVTNAIYQQGALTGVNEDGTEVAVGQVDMIGGL